MSIGGKKKQEETTQAFQRVEATAQAERAASLEELQRTQAFQNLSSEQKEEVIRRATSDLTQEEIDQATRTAGVTTTAERLDPTAQLGLEGIIRQAQGLEGAELAAGLSPETQAAIAGIGAGVGGVDPLALSTIRDVAGGAGVRSGTEARDRAAAFAAEQAERQVSDLFTLGGRSGSAAQARSVARGVAEAVSPFAFGFERDELVRQDQARAQQLAAAFGLQDITNQQDVLEFQTQIARLEASGQIDAAKREELEAPFRRLGLLGGAVTGAASLLGRGTEVGTDVTATTLGTTTGRRTGTDVSEVTGIRTGVETGLGVDLTRGARIGAIDRTGRGTAAGTSRGTGTSTEFGFELGIL